MVECVISGGQSGVDQAALRAAKSLGIRTGGYAPKGWITEDGPKPELAEFGLREDSSVYYMSRTDRNVKAADATLIIGKRSRGSNRTEDCCIKHGKKHLWVNSSTLASIVKVRLWLKRESIKTLNVAGNRESVAPGIGEVAEEFLREILK